MNPYNKRLAPPRVLGLPLLAALASLVTTTGMLLAVVLPSPVDDLAWLVAVVALPWGVWATVVGDDAVFAAVFWAAYFDARLISREVRWL
ncbi:MAG: hypothetical protein ACYDEV_10880 [Acidiferrobacter sp.]